MTIRFTVLGVFLLSLGLAPTALHAQIPVGGDECQAAINEELALEHLFFRSVIFGQKKAEDASVGEVRRDFDGNVWYKVDDDDWRSVGEGISPSTSRGDSAVDGASPIPPRRGLLETERVTTSELVPFIGQSLRALQCRLELICDATKKSLEQSTEAPVSIVADAYACLDISRQTIPECHLLKGQREKKDQRSAVETYCEEIAQQLMEQEAAIINLTVEYDAAYRTMLQLAGNFDLFLQEFRSPIVNSIRQMVNLIGSFNRIPCFLSSCDGSPPNDTP